MPGTVRGRYELDAPALRTLRELEKQGIRTEKQMREVGAAMDSIGGKNDERRIEAYRREVRDLGQTTERESKRMARAWETSTRVVFRNVSKQTFAIRDLKREIRSLSRERATIKVDTSGIALAAAQLDALDARLAALGSRNARPRVSPGGIAAAGASGVIARSGGGGADSRTVRSVSLGPLNINPRGIAAAGALALPAIPALGGAAGALGASGISGALGAGAGGIAGLGGLAVGAGSTFGAAKAVSSRVSDASKEMAQYTLVVKQFGRASTQAARAKKQLDIAMASAPRGTRQLLRSRDRFTARYRAATRPASESLMGLGLGGLQDANRLLPELARASNRNAATTERAGLAATHFAAGRTGRQFLRSGTSIYGTNLPIAERSAENAARAWVNVQRAAEPFFEDGMHWLERWTQTWDRSTRDIGKTRREIREMVKDLKAWKGLAGAVFRLLRDIGRQGRGSGRSLVSDLTDQLNVWDQWVQRNPRQVRDFFRRTTAATKSLAGGLFQISAALGRIGDDLLPLLDRFSQLVAGAGALGLLTPGAGALAYGAFRGATGRGGPGGPVGVPGGGGGAGGAAGGGVGAAGAAGAGYLAARAGRFSPGLATPERFGQRYGGLAGARYGMPTSQLGSRARGLGRLGGLGGLGRAGLAGAAKGYLPIGALLGVLAGAGFEGNAGQKVQAGLSSFTLGAVSAPRTGSMARDDATQGVRRFLEPGRSVAQVEREIRRTRGMDTSRRILGDKTAFGIGLGVDPAKHTEQRERIRLLEEERTQIVRNNRAMADDRSRQHGARAAGELQEGFARRQHRGVGDVRNLGITLGGVQHSFRGMRRAGQKELAAATFTWGRTLSRGNKAMEAPFRRWEKNVIRRFGGLARQIDVINGQIFVGVGKEWDGIRGAITSAVRRGVAESSEEWKRLRAVAMGALKDMGYSPAEARAMFKFEATGKRPSAPKGHTAGGKVILTQGGTPGTQQSGRRATGGRLAGRGMRDTIRMSDGGLGAPNELVVNRHTERRLKRQHGIDLGREVANERHPHSHPLQGGGLRQPVASRSAALGRAMNGRWIRDHALGGRVLQNAKARRGMGGGGIVPIPGNPGESIFAPILPSLMRLLNRYHARVTDGYAASGHAANSDHHWGGAVDLVPGPGGSWDQIDALARWAEPSQGNPRAPFRWVGYTGDPGHGRGNHLHLSWSRGNYGLPGGAMTGGGGRGVGGMSAPRLARRRTKLGGIVGAASQAAMNGMRAGAQRKLDRAARGGGSAGSYNGPLNRDFGKGSNVTLSPEQVARLAERAGLPGQTFAQIAHGESGYRPGAVSPDGGFGLFQITPRVHSPALRQRWKQIGSFFNPWKNTLMAKVLYDQAGGSIRPWFGTRYVTGAKRATGGRIGADYAGAFRFGGSFVTRAGRAAMFQAGEGGRRERVSVTPLRPRGRMAGRGGGGRGLSVSVNFNGPVYARSEEDLAALGSKVADVAGKRLLAALNGDAVPDEDLG